MFHHNHLNLRILIPTFCLLFYVLALSYSKTANAQSMKWAKTLIGENSIIVSSLKTDNWGNNYQTGYFYNTVDFDPNAGIDTLAVDAGPYSHATYISKIDANGNHIWAKAFLPYSSNAESEGTSLDLDGNGNVFVAGRFYDTIDFNPGPGIDTLSAPYTAFGQKNYLAKLDSNGNFNWVKTLSGNFTITAIRIDAANNILIQGSYSGTVDFDPGAGVTLLTTSYSSSLFLLKLNNNGDFLWVKQWENSAQLNIIKSHLLDIDQNSNIYMSGDLLDSTLDIDPGAATYNVTGKGFIVKMNPAGDFLWGGGNTAIFPIIHLDHTGNLITSGTYKGGADTDPGPGTFYANGDGSDNIFLTKSDPNGNLLWSKTLIRPNSAERAYTITTDSNGQIFMGGFLYWDFTNQPLDCDPDTSNYILPINGRSFLMYSMDSLGNFLWAKTTIPHNYACSLEDMLMVVNPTNDLIVAGNYCNTLDIDFSPATFNIGVLGKKSIFLMKYNYCGSLNEVYHVGCNNVVLQDTTYLLPVNYVKEYLSATNCDSNVNIHVSLLNLITNQVINTCDTFNYYGQTYTQSGNYTQIVPNGIGCDSVHTLQLNINTPANQPSFLNLIQTLQPTVSPGGNVYSNNIEIDSLYNIYICGSFNHWCNFNPLGTAYIDSSYYIMYNGSDGFVTRYDSTGQLTWMHKVQTMDPNGSESVHELVLNDSLDLHGVSSPYGYVVHEFDFNNTNFGTTQIGSFFMPGFNGYVRIQEVLNDPASNNLIVTIGSIDSANNPIKKLYVKRGNNVAVFSAGGNYIGYEGAIDLQGNIYVASNMQVLNGGPTYCTLAKLDSNLNLIWNKQIGKGDEFGFTPQGMRVNNIQIDANGNILICGYFPDSIDIDLSPNIHFLNSTGGYDAFIACIDTSANLVWAHSYGGTNSDDHASAITTDLNGNIYVGGGFSSSIDLDPSAGVSFFMKGCANADWKGGYISKFKSDGTFVKGFGTGSISEIEFKAPNRIYAVGSPFLQVFELEQDTIINNTNAICAGDSISVGNSTYFQTGTYVDTFELIIGIDSIVITNLVVNSLPNVIANATDSVLCIGDSVMLFGSGALAYVWNNLVIDSMQFLPNITSNYLVTGTDINGCVNTDSITVTVNALPNVVANSSDSSICIGNPVVLFGTGADSFIWTNNVLDSVAFYPIDTAMYVVTGVDNNGCINQDSLSVFVNQIPIPVLVFSGDTLYCTNVTGVNIYWFKDTVAIDSLVNYYVVTQNGNYKVFVLDSNGCAGADSISMTNVGYLTHLKSDVIQVYPNPTQSAINIVFDMIKAGDVELMINDLLGNKLYASKKKIRTSGKQQFNIDLTQYHFTTGIYFLNLIIDGRRSVVKFEYQKQ